MKVAGAAKMIVLLDAVLPMLMLFMIQQSPQPKLVFDAPWKGMKLVVVHSQKTYLSDGTPYQAKSNYFTVKCPWNHCQNQEIVIEGKLLRDISEAYLIGCRMDKSRCYDMSIPINKRGMLDWHRFYEMNRFGSNASNDTLE
jgi:hypothetical protein